MGKKSRQSVDGAQRKPAAASATAAPPKQPAAAAPGPQGGETAPLHHISRVAGVDSSGLPRDELLITVHLPEVTSASDVSDLVIRAERISLRVAGKFRLELPLDMPVLETPLSVKLSKVRPAVCARSLASDAPLSQQSGELKIHLAALQQGASTRAASSPLASAMPERQPDFEAQPASPSASAVHAEAEALAREAMSAVQAEDLTLAQQLMAKAALLWPSEYAEALELIEAAQRSVGAEADAPVEPVPAAAEPAASPEAGENAPPATPPPESGGGGSSRKHKSKRGRTAAAATPPASAPPAAAEPEPTAGGVEEEVDMDALYQHLTLEVVAVAVWQVWTEFLTEYLPLVADAIGWADGEGYLRGALAAESPVRGKVLAYATAVVLVLGFLAAAALLLISRRALGLFANALWFCWLFAAAILRGISWEPVWYLAWPACIVARLQTRVPFISAFWAAPAWWWLLGGRMWALLGSALCLGSLIILGRGNYYISVCGWTLLRGACAFRSWWLRIPAGLIVLAAWVFCFLAWLQALVNAEANRDSTRPGELSVDVPKDAEGEVARILGCRTYYEVLEVGDDTDEEAVRKAHRRKALLVHPDKCSSPHAKVAFQRVQDGFILLKDKTSKREYDELLSRAEPMQATGPAANTGDADASGPRHRQRGRRGRR